MNLVAVKKTLVGGGGGGRIIYISRSLIMKTLHALDPTEIDNLH